MMSVKHTIRVGNNTIVTRYDEAECRSHRHPRPAPRSSTSKEKPPKSKESSRILLLLYNSEAIPDHHQYTFLFLCGTSPTIRPPILLQPIPLPTRNLNLPRLKDRGKRRRKERKKDRKKGEKRYSRSPYPAQTRVRPRATNRPQFLCCAVPVPVQSTCNGVVWAGLLVL